MRIDRLLRGGHQAQKREVISESDLQRNQVITECYCPHGHAIVTEATRFQGHPGLALKLKSRSAEGLLLLSPVVGDRDRLFIDFDQQVGEVVEICCPVCAEPFPVYNVCPCGAHLVALFTSPMARFSQCVGICQRLGCLYSELLSERDLRLYSRQDYL